MRLVNQRYQHIHTQIFFCVRVDLTDTLLEISLFREYGGFASSVSITASFLSNQVIRPFVLNLLTGLGARIHRTDTNTNINEYLTLNKRDTDQLFKSRYMVLWFCRVNKFLNAGYLYEKLIVAQFDRMTTGVSRSLC
ncbi:hypothetical protein RclHR1_10750005 [Rhizophagus clarus]|uniref:Uncharacterized protein n=1 Tax=Rhizophagus clarus TaxID=94130 RepID=A0A2Z6QV85_9GLOM|nr:hypothetical protein RclHR1_10750005 [Rhizophagus clarus]